MLASDLCVREPSDSGIARSVLPELANTDVPAVELAEQRTVIPHQTHLHTGTGIALPLHCFISQPVNSEVSQPELSHIPPPSALNKTVHAEEHKPSKAASTRTRVFLKKKIFRFRFKKKSHPHIKA